MSRTSTGTEGGPLTAGVGRAVALVLGLTALAGPAMAQPTLGASATTVTPGAAVTVTITGTPGQQYALLGSSVGAGMAYAGVNLGVGADFVILSVGAINDAFELMDYDLAEAEFSRVVMDRAERVIVVADGSKFGRQGLVRVAGLDAIDLLITDAPPPPQVAAHLAANDVAVAVA